MKTKHKIWLIVSGILLLILVYITLRIMGETKTTSGPSKNVKWEKIED